MNIFCAARLQPQIMEEARLVANLKHRNILSMIGVSKAEHIVLVMELASLGPLNKYLRSHKYVYTLTHSHTYVHTLTHVHTRAASAKFRLLIYIILYILYYIYYIIYIILYILYYIYYIIYIIL